MITIAIINFPDFHWLNQLDQGFQWSIRRQPVNSCCFYLVNNNFRYMLLQEN
jgi:hypothetical protein